MKNNRRIKINQKKIKKMRINILLLFVFIGIYTISLSRYLNIKASTKNIDFSSLIHHDCYEDGEYVDHILSNDEFCKNCGKILDNSGDIIVEMNGYCESCCELHQYGDYCTKCGNKILDKDYSIKITDIGIEDLSEYRHLKRLQFISIFITTISGFFIIILSYIISQYFISDNKYIERKV